MTAETNRAKLASYDLPPTKAELEAKIAAARPVTAQEIRELVTLYAEWAGGYGKAPVGQFGATYAKFRMGGR